MDEHAGKLQSIIGTTDIHKSVLDYIYGIYLRGFNITNLAV